MVELGLAGAGGRPHIVKTGAVDPVNPDELVGRLQDAGACGCTSRCQPWGSMTLVTGHVQTISAGHDTRIGPDWPVHYISAAHPARGGSAHTGAVSAALAFAHGTGRGQIGQHGKEQPSFGTYLHSFLQRKGRLNTGSGRKPNRRLQQCRIVS
jgi:hypothetical protein